MKRRLLAFMTLVCVFCCFVLAGCGGGQQAAQPAADQKAPAAEQKAPEKIVIRMANSSSTGDAVTQGADKFAELVAQKSNGAIEVQVHSNAVLGSDREATEQMQAGSLEMVDCTTGNTSTFIPALMAFDLPYITKIENSDKLFDALDNGELGKYYDSLAAEKNMKILAFFDYGYRNYVTTKKPIACLADLKGAKFRTTASLVEQEVVKAIGGQPMQISWADTYTAMQQGTVDGESNTWTLLHAAKHDEVLKYAVDSGHNYSMQLVIVNKEYWDKMSPENQAILQEAALEAAKFEREVSLKLANESKEAMKAAGVEIHDLTDAERAEFVNATAPVWDMFKDKIDQKAVELLQATQK